MSQNKLEIPGLSTNNQTKLTEAEVQAQRQAQRQAFALAQKELEIFHRKGISSVAAMGVNDFPNSMTTTETLSVKEIADRFGIQYIPLTSPNANPYYKGSPSYGQQGIEYDKLKKYGPSPSRSNNEYEEELLKYMKAKIPKKSAFEEILDELFTFTEKEQFLIDIGYMIEFTKEDTNGNYVGALKITRKLADGTTKTITNSLEDLFLKEITVKFRNLLLAKSILKLKLPEVKNENTGSTENTQS